MLKIRGPVRRGGYSIYWAGDGGNVGDTISLINGDTHIPTSNFGRCPRIIWRWCLWAGKLHVSGGDVCYCVWCNVLRILKSIFTCFIGCKSTWLMLVSWRTHASCIAACHTPSVETAPYMECLPRVHGWMLGKEVSIICVHLKSGLVLGFTRTCAKAGVRQQKTGNKKL